MLRHEENAYMCDVRPGAPMHELLRRYWLPAGLSSDVANPDSDPVRITLLSRSYVMFRDSAGQVGVLDENCSHRGASLALGRVEEGGIRCIYHGWKFAADGAVLEMPNVGDCSLGRTFRQPSYPVREAGGFVWVYLGSAQCKPPFPHYPFFDIPPNRRYIGAPIVNANFVQVLEGAIDSAHLGVLHADVHSRGAVSVDGDRPITGQIAGQFVNAVAPRVEVKDTPWGFRYAALRELNSNAGTRVTQARVTSFFLPFCSIVTDEGSMLMAVPVTSEWTIHYHVFWQPEGPRAEEKLDQMITFLGWKDETLQSRERARLNLDISGTPCRANGYGQNRAGMRAKRTFSGITNVVIEDVAVTETMGAISDRSIEHLVPADAAVVRARRLLIRNARKVENNEDPVGLVMKRPPLGGQGFVTAESPWQSWFDDWSLPAEIEA